MKDKINRKSTQTDLTSKAKLRLPKDYPWIVLSSLISDLSETFTEDELELLNQIIRDRDIDALFTLDDWWGLQSLSPSQGTDHIAKIRSRYLVSALLKKYQFDSDKTKRKDAAITVFRKAESNCKVFNQTGFKQLVCGKTEYEACVYTYAKAFLKNVLGERCLSKELVTTWSRHGPGSNLDTLKGQISLFDKYENWPYSVTKLALPYARFLIESDERWIGALQESYRRKYDIPISYPLDMQVFWSRVFKIVPGNRIAFVPKNAKTERSIAIEPTMNLFLQLGVDGYIRKRLKRWDIDLDSQEKNQILEIGRAHV